MIELPESHALALEADRLLAGRTVLSAEADHAPHKFAWYCGDPSEYGPRLQGKRFTRAQAHGGLLNLYWEDVTLTFGDGIRLRLYPREEPVPDKHQLRLDLDDGSRLLATVQMYGGIWCYPEGTFDNPYHQSAMHKPSPYSPAFDETYFSTLFGDPAAAGSSVKAFLATNQRIPGLGNGCLQDLLLIARIHPKTKIGVVNPSERQTLFSVLRSLLLKMREEGGRDTEIRLDGRPGGYRTMLGAGKQDTSCPFCGTPIVKEAYMGGSIYFCPNCQPIHK